MTTESVGNRTHRVEDQRTEDDRTADARLDRDEGLTATEAAARHQRYGPNAISEEHQSVLREIASHFWGPISWMIEAALVLTALTGRWADFAIIFALLLLNGVVGFWEEHQAAGAIEALKERLAKQARVKRDGAWTTLDAGDLVPGDLIALERGDVIPADAVIVEGRAQADESALTGESLPVEKQPGDEIYSGSVVNSGGPVARVLATGSASLFGRTVELAELQTPPSHLQQAVVSIGKYLIVLALALVGVVVAVSLLRGESITSTLEFAMVITIASVPVALPAVLSVTMAVGARNLARRDAVVSHLPVVEEMAGVDILCADKTGTITKNQVAVTEVQVLGHDSEDEVLLQAALTSEPGSGDPIDQAILQRVDQARLQRFKVLDLQPFDPESKRAEARARVDDATESRFAKGAVQAIVDLVSPDREVSVSLAEATDRFAKMGYRTLAVARADDAGWTVTGVLGLEDPPRDDSRETLDRAAHLGVEVKMVTGDRVEIAREIATEIGMGSDILEADVLHGDDPGQLPDIAEKVNGFAQVVPEDKYRIVEALQSRGHIVGMTGDGVNDVPALERAEAGIAVSGATDAARAAGDIVLLAPGLSTIIDAIHLAREAFERMKNYTIYRITETVRVIFFITISILALGFFPVTPIQVVLLAILNDAAILSIAYDRVRGAARPVRWGLSEVIAIATVLGLAGVVSSLGFLWITHAPLGLSDAQVQTALYLKLSVAGHLTVFVVRTHGPFWTYRPASILLGAVLGTQILATVIAVSGFLMEPIPLWLAALAWAYAAVWFVLLDQVKVVAYRVLQRRGIAEEELSAV